MSIIKLGGDLRVARERRKESLRSWASRINVSVPTLRRMEAGDPSVGISVYVTAIWLSGMLDRLNELVAPEHDRIALQMEIRAASRARK